MWNLVKGLSKIQYDQICLIVPTIHSPVQVAYGVVHKLDQLTYGFENHADSQQVWYLMISVCWCYLLKYALGFCSRFMWVTPVYN